MEAAGACCPGAGSGRSLRSGQLAWFSAEGFLVGGRKGSTIMIQRPIYADTEWCVVGLWRFCRVITRSTLHNPTTLHPQSAPSHTEPPPPANSTAAEGQRRPATSQNDPASTPGSSTGPATPSHQPQQPPPAHPAAAQGQRRPATSHNSHRQHTRQQHRASDAQPTSHNDPRQSHSRVRTGVGDLYTGRSGRGFSSIADPYLSSGARARRHC
jgi:hypothetical protein